MARIYTHIMRLTLIGLLMLAVAPCKSFATGPDAQQTDCSLTNPPTCSYVVKGQTAIIVPTAVRPTKTACIQVQNNCTGDIMVPTSSDPEWDTGIADFIDKHESCAILSTCPTLAVSLTATPSQITAGSSTTLTWTITGNVAGMTCTPGSSDGSWPSSPSYTYAYVNSAANTTGTATVTPTSSNSTTYTLSCTDGINTGANTAIVTITTAAATPNVCVNGSNNLIGGSNEYNFTTSSYQTTDTDNSCNADSYAAVYNLNINGTAQSLQATGNYPSDGGHSPVVSTTTINGDIYKITVFANETTTTQCQNGYQLGSALTINGSAPTLSTCPVASNSCFTVAQGDGVCNPSHTTPSPHCSVYGVTISDTAALNPQYYFDGGTTIYSGSPPFTGKCWTDCSTNYSFIPAVCPTAPACGGAAGGTGSISAPTSNLCGDGSTPTVSHNSGKWQWSCGATACNTPITTPTVYAGCFVEHTVTPQTSSGDAPADSRPANCESGFYTKTNRIGVTVGTVSEYNAVASGLQYFYDFGEFNNGGLFGQSPYDRFTVHWSGQLDTYPLFGDSAENQSWDYFSVKPVPNGVYNETVTVTDTYNGNVQNLKVKATKNTDPSCNGVCQ